MPTIQDTDVVVVGAGLAGLTAATFLARGGLDVAVCERASEPGGRGRTRLEAGFALNHGPHALYLHGPGAAVLARLGVRPDGRSPTGAGQLLRAGRSFPLPTRPLATLTSPALSARGKLELVALFARLGRVRTAGLARTSTAAWLAEQVHDPSARALLGASMRLSSFVAELDTLSADAGVAQLRHAVRGVAYLDGGWARLVAAVAEQARAAGAALELAAKVEAIEPGTRRRWAVRLGERTIACDRLVVAGSPSLADRLLAPLGLAPASGFAGATRPVRAACLDLGLRGRWPGPARILDLDRPVYVTESASVAAVAPPEHALLSGIWYRREVDAGEDARIEAQLREVVAPWLGGSELTPIVDRFLPNLIVAHDRPRPERGGLAGRARVEVGEGVCLAGDWVGEVGLLLDASLASAEAASERLLDRARAA